MPDVFTPEKRSAVMARIHGRGNKDTELRMIALFREHGITGWRRNTRIFGKPDFIFRRERVAVFVDGCFWHGCPLHCRPPATNPTFWSNKLAANKARDKTVNSTLRKTGWRVVRIWEHDLAKRPSICVRRILRCLQRDAIQNSTPRRCSAKR